MEKKINILMVDDEWNMRNLLKLYIANAGWNVTEANSGEEAIHLFNQSKFDLIILDIMMPGIDGWEVCKYIREKSNVPILMLTAINQTQEKVQGLNLGADDYLTKPFDKDEFVARVRALIRRIGSQLSVEHTPESVLSLEEIIINPDSREVKTNGITLTLTPKEFDVFYLLAKKPNQVFSREVLLEQVWGPEFYGDFRTVDQHVKNIREKLKKAGCSYNPVQTVWGVGYKLQGKKSDE